ncbi:ABC transporter ATP-binding protein [Mycobacterium sp. 236(2023)]|uniref:ABC transporter ATP-binding protein n=1 Tax=Mycobacterium sp. 236(2023) TaxID=3038163 RepID=UPI002414F136|nr:ABC transporter ATP-binding protein [Mycobacterium sp. 236(2023)]MDG4667642.1 ABC transporter ATP-binding protein [Mycobacterium sp. 236(2023)]
MPEPLLELSDLVVTYPGPSVDARPKVALDHVNLVVNRGEFVAVVGESGSGKTTLANTVVGLLPGSATVTAATLTLGGRNTLGLSEREWSRIRGRTVGLVPQDPGASLNPVRTIGSQLAEVFELRAKRLSRREIKQRSIAILEEVEIDQPERRLKQYPGELSGGMRQRVLIAIAFGLNPDLIVADEPTSALDVTVQASVLRIFDRLVSEHGSTVLFVTHDIGVATDHASRVIVMRHGAVVEDAPVETIVTEPQSEYATRLIRRIGAIARPERDATEPHGETVIDVAGATKEYRLSGRTTFAAAADISLRVRRGETVALVGESGSGKSTTAKMIIGLTKPTSGSVTVLGRDIAALSHRARREHWRDIQFVYQNPDSALDPRWTVQQILDTPLTSYGLHDRKERTERIAEALDGVNLSADKLERRAAELSGGERQRVAIARALVVRPQVIVLDEPLSALDVVTQDQIIGLLLRLQSERDLTYLFISHDLSVVKRLAHHVVVLKSGQVVETGSTADVFEAPQADYTRALLDAIPGRRLAALALAAS